MTAPYRRCQNPHHRAALRSGGLPRRPVRRPVGRPAPGRAHAPGVAGRVRRPGPPARPRLGAAHGDRGGPPPLDDPVRAAGHRQDHARPPARGELARRLRGGLRGQRRPRRGARGAPARPAPPRHQRRGHDLLPRRDPPLQQGAAGHAAARGRGGARGARRRHHREPLLRGQLGAAVALPRLRAARARRRPRAGAAAPLARRRARHRRGAARGRRRARVPRRALGRRRAHRAVGARAGLRDRRRGRHGLAARGRGRAAAQRDPLRQGRRPPLRPDLGVDQGDARLGPGRVAALPGRDARGRRGPALHRAADGDLRQRGHRQRRPARARGGRQHRTRRRARRHAGVRAQPLPGRRLPGAGAEVATRRSRRSAGRASGCASTGLPEPPARAAQRRLPGREEARPRPRLRLPARPPRGGLRAGADAGRGDRRALPRAERARRGARAARAAGAHPQVARPRRRAAPAA